MPTTMRVPFFLLLILAMFACRRPIEVNDKPRAVNMKEPLVHANELFVKNDMERIKQFAAHQGWDMQLTPTGLWYMVYEKGNGPAARQGCTVGLAYTVSLLDGTVCYTSDSLGLKEFVLGSSPVERGLTEGVALLQQGDKARLILAPHMGFGLLGDEKLIPPRATIVYDLSLVHVSEKK